MDKIEWRKKYKQWLMDRGIEPSFAQQTVEAGEDGFDFDDDPREAAEDELSYW